MKFKLRRFFIPFFVLCGATALTIGVLEFALREFESRTSNNQCEYKLNPAKLSQDYALAYKENHYPPCSLTQHCSPDFNVIYTIDGQGFRNLNRPQKLQSGLLALGDSFTYGYGVSDTETFSHHLNAYNAGLWGQTFDRHFIALNNVLKNQNPSIVMWGIYPPHLITMTEGGWVFDCPGSINLIRNIPEKVLPAFDLFVRGTKKIKQNSSVYRLVMNRLGFRNFGLKGNKLRMRKECYLTKEPVLYDAQYLSISNKVSENEIDLAIHEQLMEAYSEFSELMKKAKLVEEKNKVKFLFYFIPSKNQLLALKKKSKLDAALPMKIFSKSILQAGFRDDQILDLAPAFNKENWKNLYFSEDAHWNAKGHLFASKLIKNKIKNWPEYRVNQAVLGSANKQRSSCKYDKVRL